MVRLKQAEWVTVRLAGVFGGLLLTFVLSSSAHAASLTVSGGCSLNSAITSVNTASDTGGCTSTGTYGSSDTITLPSGTIALTADLPAHTAPVTVTGVGKTVSTINANGFKGFNGDFSSVDTGLYDFVYQDFTITGASEYGLSLLQPKSVTMTRLRIDDSQTGAIATPITLVVTNSDIVNNTGFTVNFPGALTGTFAGLLTMATPIDSADSPSITITGSTFNNNTAETSGLWIAALYQTGTGNTANDQVTIERTTVLNNTASKSSGIIISQQDGVTAQVPLVLRVDGVTVASNAVTVTSANPLGNQPITSAQPYGSGLSIVARVADNLTFTNLTLANNSVVNNYDDQPSLAGLVASLSSEGSNLKYVNSTVVNNTVTQADPGVLFGSFIQAGFKNVSFYAIKVQVLPSFDLLTGASAQNSIIAGNSRNGQIGSCVAGDKAAFGLSGTLDLTPTNLGNNLTDDPSCTGYNVIPNLVSTLGSLQDNGGPVPTIALLPGSPAIGFAQQVLGISTDARGIARPATPDAGAYQTVLGANTDTPGGQATQPQLPNTGENSIFYTILSLISLTIGVYVAYVYWKNSHA